MKKLKTIFTERWLGYTATAVIAVLLYEMLEHLDRLKPAFSGIWSFISPILIGIAIEAIKILSEMLEEMKAGQVESEEEYEAVDMEVEESEVEMDMMM